MKLAYFSGCKIPFFMKDYDLSFRAVMQCLDVELVEPAFNCCGNPARNDNFEVSVLSAVKNMALAQTRGLDIITPCKCCFGQFKHADYWYRTDPALKERVDRLLARENLSWNGETRVKHLLLFLKEDVGLDRLKERMVKKLAPKKIAVQYGCHALRPFSVTGFDNPFAPRIFEQVLALTGVRPVQWSKSTECCGNPILDNQKELSLKIVKNKFDTAKQAGADYICTACTHCQMQYETAKADMGITENDLKTLLFTQIIGAALGVEEQALSENGRLPGGLFHG